MFVRDRIAAPRFRTLARRARRSDPPSPRVQRRSRRTTAPLQAMTRNRTFCMSRIDTAATTLRTPLALSSASARTASLPARCRVRLCGLIALILAGALPCATALAQNAWEVHDKHANDHLAEIEKRIGDDGTVNGNLKKLAKIGGSGKSGDDAKEPEEKLNPAQPSDQVAKTVNDRCPSPGAAAGAAQQQWQLCQEIVKTELAQYKYSMTMYALARTRQQRLQEIERERGDLGADEQGKLQDNTNKLLALLSRMEVDRQQSRAYMDAYAARLAYLRAVRDMLSNEVLRGKDGGGSGGGSGGGVNGRVAAGVVGLATMKAALDAVKTERKGWPR
ncbi:hypothetical protein [Lysobacter enzymogenes]|uniref:hypothetical protein n=1 Tax=Lysobacter enzymogenes TaxID=69 RepID=UPI0022651A51|nr:hypothetical protein [Lysobacter enzymogenes]UZW59294.1 hypothetical protein BV903_018585 [Lysobacter enzymogenes]